MVFPVSAVGTRSAAQLAARLLNPLGKPSQNARKWFAAVEIERMSHDPDWLDKAIRIVEKQIQEMNEKQRGKGQSKDIGCVS